jgi:photosystem II stability/assembly factor-like uncharacterized protein
MRAVRDDEVIAVGTAKGAFLLTADGMLGPLFPGERVPSLAIDTRHDPPRLLAGVVSEHWGPTIRVSDDLGHTWTDPAERRLRFPADTGAAVAQVWQLQPAGRGEPDAIYAGVEPAALFRSDDRGETWSLVRGLWDHPHRPQWVPGFGGLGLHTVLVDPRDSRQLHIAISAGGVYRSDDGGATWEARNQGIRTPAGADDADPYPDFGQCVHKIARDAVNPDRLYAQNHGGLYRTDDRGDTWVDVANGVPSDFGFPIVAHPRAGDTAYVVPLQSAEYRCTPDGQCRVYRTTDAGNSWAALDSGLPSEHAHLTVLRDAFCSDEGTPPALSFGTRSGQVYSSLDEGETWELRTEYLPPVLCVRAASIG